ncbi:hypothetical protein GCM10029992_07400 [Glycomyces albus]
MVARPFAADLLEVRSEDLAVESGLRAVPETLWSATELPVGPVRAQDRLIERDERLVHAVYGPVLAERVRLSAKQPRILQDMQRVSDIAGLAADIGGDAAAGGVARGHGGEHGVVQPRIADVGLLAQQVASLLNSGLAGFSGWRSIHGSKSSIEEGASSAVNCLR